MCHRISESLKFFHCSISALAFIIFFRLCRVFFFRSRREVLIDFVLKPVFDTENEFVTGMRDAEMKCNLRQPQLAVESSHRHRLQAEESLRIHNQSARGRCYRAAQLAIKDDLSLLRKKKHNERGDNLIKTVFSFFYYFAFWWQNVSPSGIVILSPEDEKRHQRQTLQSLMLSCDDDDGTEC